MHSIAPGKIALNGEARPVNMPLSKRTELSLRVLLLGYLFLIFCPLQYWPIVDKGVDRTWFFALNYAASHHLVMGSDIEWTSGPLSYLALPMNTGNNLAQGVAFQFAVWIVTLAILWDVFFRSGLRLRNLVFFTVCFGLSGVLYPIALGSADVLFTGALILLVQFLLRGQTSRLVVALVMLGIIPLFKFQGAMTVAGLLGGFLIAVALQRPLKMLRTVMLTIAVPLAVAAIGYCLTMHSWHNFATYLKSSLELSSGYSLAMSLSGSGVELLAAFESFILLGIVVMWLGRQDRRIAISICLMLLLPLLATFKHAFVRQDTHITYFFCFIAIALGLCSLPIRLEETPVFTSFAMVLLVFGVLYQDQLGGHGLRPVIEGVTGMKTPGLAARALRIGSLRERLDAETRRDFSESDQKIEPEIKAILQKEPMASLSMSYSGAFADGMNLTLYPVLQRYSAYTPYLDNLNAEWIKDKGPKFLVFDGKSIDGRHPWTETPAMWLEVYRWYDTRLAGSSNLLLERRTQPRFTRLESVTRSQVPFTQELRLPETTQPIFWSMTCPLSSTGKLRALLFRIPEVTVTVEKTAGKKDVFRTLPGVLGTPSLGNYLPDSLAEFAAVFDDRQTPGFSVKTLTMGGPGKSAYVNSCEMELFHPVR